MKTQQEKRIRREVKIEEGNDQEKEEQREVKERKWHDIKVKHSLSSVDL